jgi:hypothetical protein
LEDRDVMEPQPGVGAVHVALEAQGVYDTRNDGTPVTLATTPPAPQRGDVDHYEMTVHRLAQLYEQKYRHISQ